MSPVVVGRWKFGRGADPNPVIKVTSKVTPSALKEEISYSGNGRTRDAIICRTEKRTERSAFAATELNNRAGLKLRELIS